MKYKATIKREQSHARAWTLPSVSSFDVVKLLRFSLLSMLVMLFGGLTHAADPLTIDFESDAASYSDWTFTTIVSNYSNSGVTAHGGSKYGCTDGKASGSIVTKEAIANPGVLTFFVSKEIMPCF